MVLVGAAGDADHPAAPAAVAKEGAHGRRQMSIHLLAALCVPDQGCVAAKDGRELSHILHRHRRL